MGPDCEKYRFDIWRLRLRISKRAYYWIDNHAASIDVDESITCRCGKFKDRIDTHQMVHRERLEKAGVQMGLA